MVLMRAGPRRLVLTGAAWIGSITASFPVLAAGPSVEDVGNFAVIDRSDTGAVKLSGITYAGGTVYYTVGGGSGRLFKMAIDIDDRSGAIRSARFDDSSLQLKDENGTALSGTDLEGVAVDGSTVYVADENGPEISRHDLITGHRLARGTPTSHQQLKVFANAVSNRSWESLTRQPDGSAIWTANEEALTVDGTLSTTTVGTVVRLQKFDADLNPVGQWAYVTDPVQGKSGSRFDRSGVVDLVALKDGRLLVLERSTGNGFRIQLYLVDFTEATDVSDQYFKDGLLDKTFIPVSKTNLFTKTFTSRDQVNSYFVGITLGPMLDDGSSSLILIADNGGSVNFLVANNEHTLYVVKLVP